MSHQRVNGIHLVGSWIRGRSYWVLSLAAGGTLLSVLYKRYLLFSNYENPPPVITYSLLFEYLAFVAVAFIFPLSLRRYSHPQSRATFIVVVGIAFTVVYLLILSSLEWFEGGQSYQLVKGIGFSLRHSSPYVLVIYALICVFLFFLNQGYKVPADGYLQKVEYRLKNKLHFLPLEEVQLLASDGNYVAAVDREGKKHLVRKTLQSLEKEIDPDLFVRVHRGYIVNPSCIQSMESDAGGGYVLLLGNDVHAKMSKNYTHLVDELKKRASLT